jgi:hypothetical protein
MSSLSSAPPPSLSSSASSSASQGFFEEPDPGSTWCGPRFLDPEELEAAPLPPPPAPAAPVAPVAPASAPRAASAPLPPSVARVDLLPTPVPSPANRPTPRQLAITIVASLGLVAASAFVSQYVFTYLFTGHW